MIDEFSMDVWGLIASRCAPHTILMNDHVEPAWLQIFDNLVALARSKEPGSTIDEKLAFSVTIWANFGALLHLREDEVRRRHLELQAEKMGMLLGCSWYKCPLHAPSEPVRLRRSLICAKCKKVPLDDKGFGYAANIAFQAQYCGFHCQKR